MPRHPLLHRALAWFRAGTALGWARTDPPTYHGGWRRDDDRPRSAIPAPALARRRTTSGG